MKHIAAFSKYLAFNAGGAELSTRMLLEKEEKQGNRITILSSSGGKFLGNDLIAAPLPKEWNLKYLKGGRHLSRFSYLEYMINRNWLSKQFKNLEADELWTYGIWAPAAINSFPGKTVYFIRSETDLGSNENHLTGLKYYAKQFYSLIQTPAFKIYRNDLKQAVKKASVIVNSNYMAERALGELNVTAEVSYPIINIEELSSKLKNQQQEKKWIVFIGDSPAKGTHLVIEMAKKLPKTKFRIFSRFVEKQKIEDNICWMPWQTDSWKVYEGAKLVIVPSQWEEAYGRVAREAFLLNLPVLVSQVGGLPEAVEYKEKNLVFDFKNVEAWIYAIHRILSDNNVS